MHSPEKDRAEDRGRGGNTFETRSENRRRAQSPPRLDRLCTMRSNDYYAITGEHLDLRWLRDESARERERSTYGQADGELKIPVSLVDRL